MSKTTNPVARAQRVADVVTSALAAVSTKDQDRKDAKGVLTVAADDAISTREGQLVTLANTSATEKWELSDIKDGIAAALAQRNGKDTAINTFASEIKRACHPDARSHVSALQKLAQNVWDAELATEDKAAPRPLRTAFARRYHMLQRMIGKCVTDKQPLKTPTEAAEWAVSLNPSKDPSKAFKRYTALLGQIRAILDEHPDFERGTDAVGETEPVMGVSDLLDEALRDIEAA